MFTLIRKQQLLEETPEVLKQTLDVEGLRTMMKIGYYLVARRGYWQMFFDGRAIGRLEKVS